MGNAFKNWRAMPDGGSDAICHLIESEEVTHHVNETGSGNAGLRKMMGYV